jgi:hypothetical protein
MKKTFVFPFLCLVALLMTSCTNNQSINEVTSWKDQVHDKLGVYGHRNWIIISDNAFPYQAGENIDVIVSDKSLLETIQFVANEIESYSHIKPAPYADLELDFVREIDLQGISQFRKEQQAIFDKYSFQKLPHLEIVEKIKNASELFKVLTIKTKSDIPYGSIFIELDCNYWNQEAENNVRQGISKLLNKTAK